ncbi:MAG: GyrI-like domain-containing protein [Cytophagaceae bacterium]|jgi:AraC family transcriptional regulator|nr:GyrI-like domain-containing protein [Cytophagaceae bacterium]
MKLIEPKFQMVQEIKLVGLTTQTSLTNNKTAALWQSFMPRRSEIQSRLGQHLFSVQQYGPEYFQDFQPHRYFTKWATAEVSDWERMPDGMQALLIPQGLYAVFSYKGSSNDSSIYRYIFETWLPDSGFELDPRPHFERLDDRYKNNDPDSEEEIFIPVKRP